MALAALRDTLLSRLRAELKRLPDKSHETPEHTLAALEGVARDRNGQIDEGRLRGLVEQRLAGAPLAYLSGREYFMNVEIATAPGAMIPRRETELLGEVALECLNQRVRMGGSATLFDLCTGTGNLALALAWHEPKCRAWGSDISDSAIKLAKSNCRRLGLEERVDFLWGDFLQPFAGHPLFGQVDLLVCNPPYISSGKLPHMAVEIAAFEPGEAFDGGPLGISFLVRLVHEAHQAVKPGGWVACEVGAGQGEALLRMFSRSPAFESAAGFNDPEGRIRVVRAQKKL